MKNLNELEKAYYEAVEAEKAFQPTGNINEDRARLIALWAATSEAFEAYHEAIRAAIGMGG